MNQYPDSRNGGIENVTRMLSERFAENGHSICVLFLNESDFDHSDDSPFVFAKRIMSENVESEIRELVRVRNIDIVVNRCVLWKSGELRSALRETDCKLISTYNNKPTLDALTLDEISISKDIPTWKKRVIHLIYPFYKKRSERRLQKIHRHNYADSDKLVLLSGKYIDEYASMMGIDRNKIEVKNNPIRNELAIDRNELASKERIVLMVTRLDENQKCIKKALMAWERVQCRVDGWRLVIVGNGPDKKLLMDFIEFRQIKNVELHKACNPLEFYRKSSLFLMTSRNEGWPNTLNEAMRMGCVPIVTASFSAVYDMIDNEENGIIVKEDNEEAEMKTLIESMQELMTDQTRYINLSVNAIRKTERLSIDNIAREWIQMFESIRMKK